MTTAVYSCCAGIRTAHAATRDSSWAFFALFAGMAAFWGWIAWLASEASCPEADAAASPLISVLVATERGRVSLWRM